HVENHAQHLDYDAFFPRLDRRGTRLISAASHFAEQFAGTEFRQRTIDRKIDIRVDADEFSLVRFRTKIGLVVGQKTFHSLKTAPEQSDDRIGAQMRERIVNENVDRAGDDVIRGRTERAFFAHDLAFAITMENSRAFGPVVQLGAWNFF